MVIEELNRLKVKFTYQGVEYLRVLCPFHEDGSASLNIHFERGTFNCFSCNSKGAFPTYLAKVQSCKIEDVLQHLHKVYNYKYEDLIIAPQTVDAAHFRLFEAGPLLEELKKRGVNREVIDEHKLGEENGRIFIPIYSNGNCVNIQTYSPGARTRKFESILGQKMERFYPDNQLDKPKIVVAGGLIKALAAGHALKGTDIGAVSVTAGEGVWSDELTLKLQGKIVYLCFDIDSAGRRAARKIARKLGPYAAEVYDIKLDLDPEAFPKGGVDDYIVSGGNLVELLKKAKPETYRRFTEELKPHEELNNLFDVYSAENSSRELTVPAYVAGVCETPFILPQSVQILCNYDCGIVGLCTLCPVNTSSHDLDFVHEIDTRSRNFLAMVNKEDSKVKKIVQRDIGIPSRCGAHTQKILTQEKIEEIRISSVNSINSIESHKDHQPAYVVGRPVESNKSYLFSGVLYPHPDTQVSTLVFNEAEILQASLDSWKLQKPERMEALRAEAGAEGIKKKLDEIYTHMELDITKIYNRRHMTMIYDLTYHSVIRIAPFGDFVRGWLESLVCGDSSCGKSDTIDRLMTFYGAGEKIDCANATAAGLIGGNEQSGSTGGKHFVIWGALPRNDRGIVNFEELASLPPAIFNMLTEVRSSGVARITKISSKSALSRTRLTANSNPPSRRTVSTYAFGIDVISELIKAPADIRRFDMALVVRDGDTNKTPPARGAKFDEEVLRDCLMFAWTRKPEQVIFSEPDELNAAAERLCKDFVSEKVPLVDKGSQPLKVARLATAIAAKTWSVLDDNLIVNKFHIQVAEDFLREIYCSDAMGYKKVSESLIASQTLRDEKQVRICLAQAVYPQELVEMFQAKGIFEAIDLKDHGGFISKEIVEEVLGTLIRNRAIERKTNKGYVKTPAFVEFLNTYVPGKPAQEQF